ncbi:HYDIN protein, partial [Sapayoa aenigma]|nr:HYDIN protein [Sapayoa aenigma]
QDYFHQVLCITEREEFFVPIQATAARPVLDFPEQLDFSDCPVNHSTQKILFIHNSGNLEARYHISTQRPFAVFPAMGTLGIGETMELTVEFHPLKIGFYSSSLTPLCFTPGKDIHTSLLGRAVDVNVALDKNSVKFEKTYITLSNHRTVVIHNRTNITAHFRWKSFATEEEEIQQKLRLCHRLSRPAEDKLEDFLKGRYRRLSALSRACENEMAKVEADPMMFPNDVFIIEPLEGEVGPNCSTEINVFFNPQEAQVYEKVAYCDIAGREYRLPLRLTAEGLGPCLRLSFEELDIGKVFAGAVNTYEAILANKGAIDAPFKLISPITTQGSCFTFVPQQGIIAPNGFQSIQISFCSTIMGDFCE